MEIEMLAGDINFESRPSAFYRALQILLMHDTHSLADGQ